MSTLSIIKIEDGLWQFSENLRENHNVDAYLVTGGRRALLIDALQDSTGVYQEIRKLSDLPLDCLICHGHGDHDGPACREIREAGGKVYIHPEDIPLAAQGRDFPGDFFTPILGGGSFDLGGLLLEVFHVAGHTPGSLAVLERKRRWLFSSDTLGSGPFWIQLPHSLPLRKIRDNIKAFYGELKQFDDLVMYPGHRYQSPNQLGLQYIADTLESIEFILEEKLKGTEVETPPGRQGRWVSVDHKSSLGLVYNPGNL